MLVYHVGTAPEPFVGCSVTFGTGSLARAQMTIPAKRHLADLPDYATAAAKPQLARWLLDYRTGKIMNGLFTCVSIWDIFSA